MTTRMGFILASALLAGMVLSAAPAAWPQESARAASQGTPAKNAQDKSNKEQSEKSKEEPAVAESSANFPQLGGAV